jgi:hypothetical protein
MRSFAGANSELLQYCASCGNSIEDQASFCPFCGHEVKQAVPVPQTSAPAQNPAISAPTTTTRLTPEQQRVGDEGIAAAALNFLFWGVGYKRAGVERPFGRPWILWPLIYIAYAFLGQLLVFTLLPETASLTTTQIPTGNGTSIPVTTVGYNPYPALLTKDLEILAFLIPGLVLGFLLARDVYRRMASRSDDPASVPSARAALASILQRSVDRVSADEVQSNPATAFAVIGGVLLLLGSASQTVLDWLSSQTFAIGGISELEGTVLGALIVYLAIMVASRPAWRQTAGVFIIAMALIVLSHSTGYAVELGLGFAVIGGALLIASGGAKPQGV